MKRIEFKQVGMKNFCNYIEPMELKFENGKLVVITGPNGIGKSNMFEALPFTLYGITSEGMRGDDVVNNEIGKDCHTWVEFEVNDNSYRIDRYHNFTRKGNTVELSKNKESPYKVGHREVLPEIEKLIVPRKLFTNTLLFGQNIKDFFTDLTDTQKKEVFRKVLQLDNYSLYYEEAKRRIKEISERVLELNQLLEVQSELLVDAKNQIGVLNQAKREFEENKNNTIKGYKQELIDLIEKRNNLTNELNKYSDFPSKIELMVNKINLQNRKISELSSNLDAIQESINSKKLLKESDLKKVASEEESKIRADFYRQKTEVETNNNNEHQKITTLLTKEVNDLNITIATLQNEIKSLKDRSLEIQENVIDKDISICPTCYQEIGEEEKEKLQNKIVQYNKSINNKLINQNEIQNKIENLTAQFKLNSQSLSEQKVKELTEIENGESDALSKIDIRLNEVLSTLYEKSNEAIDKNIKDGLIEKQKLELDLENLEKENDQLQIIKNEMKELEIAIPIVVSNISMIEKNIKQKESEKFDDRQLISYVNKIKELDDKIKNIELERLTIAKDLKVLEFWKIGYSQNGMPAMLIDESIPFLNKRVSYYLDKISRGRYAVSFDTMAATKAGEFRDKISVNVLDNQTKANSRIQLSGGQTRLVDIATILTLNDLQSDVQDMSINILLFDEIFDSLDDSNIGFVSNVIRTLTKDRFVSIISHRHIDQIEADEYLNLH